jgi:hypothetical protein
MYNNSHNITPDQHYRLSTPILAIAGILAMVYKSIYLSECITKISTSNTIPPYINALKITNKALTPILILNMCLPTHKENIHLSKKSKAKSKY